MLCLAFPLLVNVAATRAAPHTSTSTAGTLHLSPHAGSATVIVSTDEVVFTVQPHFLSYTIDLSAERGFFARNLTNARLRWLAKQLAPAVLRVGGSGGDDLYYDVPHITSRVCPGAPFPKCKQHKPRYAASKGSDTAQCLNTSHWEVSEYIYQSFAFRKFVLLSIVGAAWVCARGKCTSRLRPKFFSTIEPHLRAFVAGVFSKEQLLLLWAGQQSHILCAYQDYHNHLYLLGIWQRTDQGP